MSNELVEDSEPEREYIRNSQKVRVKGRGNGSSSPARDLRKNHARPVSPTKGDIIDISSDVSGIFASPATPARKAKPQERIIDISDSPDNSMTSPGALLAARALATVTQSPVIDLSPIRPSKLGMYSHAGSISDDEGAVRRPALSRFALPPIEPVAGPSKTKKTSPRPGPATSATPEPAQEKPAAKRGRSMKSDILGDLNDTQLTGLMKCICCDIKWTARKSSAQKASHISTCARKNNMAALTVQSLIRKEINNAPAPVAQPGRAVKDAHVPPSQPPTHLEDLVNHAEPKKRGRRVAAPITVLGPSVAQNDILDRARAVLHRENAPVTGEIIVHRRPVSTSGRASPQAMPEATQPFGKSGLARPGRSLFFADREDPLQENPPATQAFGTSKLGAKSRLQAPAPIASTSAISVSSSSSDKPMPAFVNNSANVLSPQRLSMRTPPPPDAQPHSFSPIGSDRFDYMDDNIYDMPEDDGWYNAPDLYDPEIRYSPPPLYFPQPVSPASEEHPIPGPSRLPADPPIPPPEPSPVRKATEKKSKKAGAAVILDDDALEAELKKLILADEALYLRILRYEPIHFDVFCELAISLGISERKLKARVRAVLDKQVISHYGAEPGGKRTRKQYHP